VVRQQEEAGARQPFRSAYGDAIKGPDKAHSKKSQDPF
jgi:hypothetical protein